MEKKKFAVCVNHEPVVVTNTYKQACRVIARQLAKDDYAEEIANKSYVPYGKISRRAKAHYLFVETDAESWVRHGASDYLDIIASDREGHVYQSRFSIVTVQYDRN